jgi:hypothetical protein
VPVDKHVALDYEALVHCDGVGDAWWVVGEACDVEGGACLYIAAVAAAAARAQLMNAACMYKLSKFCIAAISIMWYR